MLKFASEVAYLCTLNSDVPFPEFQGVSCTISCNTECISLLNYEILAVAQPNVSHIFHFGKKEVDITEGLKVLQNYSEMLYWSLRTNPVHSSASCENPQRVGLFKTLYGIIYTYTFTHIYLQACICIYIWTDTL
jgi:hypothetical protein